MGSNFLLDFAIGGVSGAVAKTCTAPIERVKLLIQTQDANPKIISGEVARYTGIGDCFSRVAAEQGISAFWRGNFTNVLRYFPTQAFNFAFKDSIKRLFPKKDPKTEFWSFFAVNMASGMSVGGGFGSTVEQVAVAGAYQTFALSHYATSLHVLSNRWFGWCRFPDHCVPSGLRAYPSGVRRRKWKA